MAKALAARSGEVIATFDVGTHQMKAAQWFPVSHSRSFITSGGMGSMGSAVPMAVGAHFARPGATVFAVAGDGGFVMSSHELDTIGGYGIPIKMVVFDDSALGMVTNWHCLFFGGRNLTSDRRRGRVSGAADLARVKESLRAKLDDATEADAVAAALCEATATLAQGEWPLFAATAAAYGIQAERVHTKAQFAAALHRAMAVPGPYLLQVMLPAPSQVYPLMEPGTTPQDMVWRETSPGSGVRVYARERFDYQARCLFPGEGA
jgi:acetolactate synthase-1/2/3 large subunit